MNKSPLEKPLKIYNASAGSGKTYQLVLQYLRLLLSNKQEKSFNEIIAMTFTNKAANEMKSKIINSLYCLSNYPNEVDGTTFSYIETLKQKDGLSEKQIISTAKKQLKKLLHTYENFHVMTIDKFNLKLIRQFSRDLDLPGQFEVVLEEREIIEQSIDLLINNVGNKNHENSTDLIYDYAKKNIDDGKKWDIRNQMIEFAEILNKESYFPKIEELKSSKINNENFQQWSKKLNLLNSTYHKLANRASDIYRSLNIDDVQLPGKSTVGNQLRDLKSFNTLEKSINKTTIKNSLKEPAKNRIFPLELRNALLAINEFRQANLREHEIIQLLKSNYYKVALLRFISDEISTIKNQDQIIRISEFNKLISKLIQESSTPYIYERIGTKYNHFLLDEFQDTSRLQWLNMIPLIEESLSKGNINFIVGDPKQAIYRFRNGLAEQFVSLPEIYNPEKNSLLDEKSNYFKASGKKETLKENRRSSISIVEFNNNLFTELSQELSLSSKEFYQSVKQKPYRKEIGYVHIVSKECEQKNDLNRQVDYIESFIRRCLSDGYKQSDICILNNKNTPLNSWGIELIKRNIPVVSSDSLFIKNEPKVNLFISYLKRRINPKNNAEIKHFAYLFLKIKGEELKYWDYFKEVVKNGETRKIFDDSKFVSEQFNAYKDLFFDFENLYGLLQNFYKLMKWNELENAYLHHLSDVVFNFQKDKTGDVQSFLTFFEKNSDKMSVQIPESENSIKMMSIHKSKGLQFPIVILPNIDFSINLFSLNKFLIKIDDKITHTNLKKNTEIEELKNYHLEEESQILTDKINLLYVALTRAEDRIYAVNEYEKNKLGKTIHTKIQKNNTQKKDKDVYFWGKEERKKIAISNSKEDSFNPSFNPNFLWFPDIALSRKKEEHSLLEQQRFGNAFHLAISKINNKKEIDEKINQLIKVGEIENCFKNELIQKLYNLFSNKKYQDILIGNSKIISEPNIVVDRANIKRPDKIIFKPKETNIIEYKTGKIKEEHKKQLREYVKYLNKMRYPKIKGFIYYTNQDYLLEIDL